MYIHRYHITTDTEHEKGRQVRGLAIAFIGFEKYRTTPKVVTAALDLYFKGVSLRKICDHLRQFYGVKMTHVSVIKWLRKFVDVVKPYVDSMSPPRLSG